MGGKTRILLADDHVVVRMGVAAAISFDRTSQSQAKRRTGRRRCAWPASSCRTWSSWTS